MRPDRLRLKYMADIRSKSDPGALPGDVSFLPMEAVGERGDFDRDSFRARDEVGPGYTYFEDGDVVRAKVTPCFENGKGAVLSELMGGRGFGSTELLALRPRPGAVARFLYYILVSHEFTSQGAGWLYGAHGVKRVPEKFFRDFVAWAPSESTQRGVTDFLDHEISRMDRLTEKKQRLTDRVYERFAALRTVLTLGRAADKPLRATEVPWIGRIPDTWKVRRLKDLAKMESGHTPNRQKPEYWVDCDIPWVTLNDLGALKWKSSIEEPKNQINTLGIANSSARILPQGTVILSRDATVGRTALLGRPMAISQHFVGWVCGNDLVPEYLLHLLRGPGKAWCDSVTAGSTILTIGMPDLNGLMIPVPPLREQREIARLCEEETVRTKRVLDLMEQEIGLLQERRLALISAAVTGQLATPHAAS
jgi:type I restriction enzyme S subunit